MGKYRKKPVVVEAIRFNGTNHVEVAQFLAGADFEPSIGSIDIKTLEGTMRADRGDWIIRGVKGELYPCKPDIFEATYEPAE
jgi:hypothetical protein